MIVFVGLLIDISGPFLLKGGWDLDFKVAMQQRISLGETYVLALICFDACLLRFLAYRPCLYPPSGPLPSLPELFSLYGSFPGSI